MSESSTGSDIVFTLAILTIFFLVLLLVRHYLPLRSTPPHLLLPVFLALALPASIVLLVPIDLASTAVPEDGVARGIHLPQPAMLILWRITYWLTFVLTWLVLPLLGDYSDAGYSTTKSRIFYALRSNARYQAIVLSCAVAGLVYYIIQSGLSGFGVADIKSLVMALAYAWGLILAIYLMGHGLVAIPRQLLRNTSISTKLRSLQTQAPIVHDRMNDAIEELEQLEVQVALLKQKTTQDFRGWIDGLVETSHVTGSRGPAERASNNASIPNVITERWLADLTRKLKRARHKRIRFIGEWERLVCDAVDTQAILDSASSKRLEPTTASASRLSLLGVKLHTAYTRHLYHYHVVPAFRMLSAGILGLASIGVVWSEIISGFAPKLSVVGLSIVHYPNSDDGKIGFTGQVMAGAWLIYMCAAALTSVSQVKVWGNRALVPRNTYEESACWYGGQVAKLTVPLSYNFITLLPRSIFHETTFFRFLGSLINFTPLGKGFSTFFPIIILVPVLATTFNLYGKVKRIVGFDVLEDESEENPSGFGTGGWREGKALIDREMVGQGQRSHLLGLSSRENSPRASTQLARSSLPSSSHRGGLSSSSSPRISSPLTGSGSSTPVRNAAPYRDSPSMDTTRLSATTAYTDDEPSGFFADLAHRMKNTLETAERPEWVQALGKNQNGSGKESQAAYSSCMPL